MTPKLPAVATPEVLAATSPSMRIASLQGDGGARKRAGDVEAVRGLVLAGARSSPTPGSPCSDVAAHHEISLTVGSTDPGWVGTSTFPLSVPEWDA